MNTPSIEWQPAVGTSGFATLSLEGQQPVRIWFMDQQDATAVHRLLCAAQMHGAAVGQRALAQLVHGTVHGFLG